MINSTESKPKGGKRLGAGRKPRDLEIWLNSRGVSPVSAAEILAFHDERKLWHRILNSLDDRVVLQGTMFLMAMRDGKPSQKIMVTSTQLTISASELERARAIVAEIRGDLPASVNANEHGSVSAGEHGW